MKHIEKIKSDCKHEEISLALWVMVLLLGLSHGVPAPFIVLFATKVAIDITFLAIALLLLWQESRPRKKRLPEMPIRYNIENLHRRKN
tara:strand:- start:7814 stop:8077 length:264 start_codon:yes stop_codon:yes gene_type:complete